VIQFLSLNNMKLNHFLTKLIAVVITFWMIMFFSYLGFLFPHLNQIAMIGIVILTIIMTIKRLEYGLLILLSELLLGSFGYLFYWPLADQHISIRLVIWSVVMLIFVFKVLISIIKEGEKNIYWQKIKNFPLLKYFGLLFLFIIIGLIVGLLRQHEWTDIFSDFNGWLYWLLLFPTIMVAWQKDNKFLKHLIIIFLAAIIIISLETLLFLFVFTHNLTIAPEIYSWLRQNLIGEITPTTSGWPRVFLQAQIFPIIGFLIIFWFNRVKNNFSEFFYFKNLGTLLLASLLLSTAIISFSRSFWAGLLIAGLIGLILVWLFYSFKKMLGLLIWSLAAGLGAILLIYLITIFPYPQPGKFTANFIDRVTNEQEAALSSRWSLLPVLSKEVIREPFLGQGFGATVTYISSDPRVLAQHPDGQYTTTAFEWGYLDIALKIGLLGLLAYGLLLIKLIQRGIIQGRDHNNYLSLGLVTAIIFLVVTHIFTPYLNHPLGIGFLIVSSCLISRDRVVY